MANYNLNKYEQQFLHALQNNNEEEAMKYIETPGIIKKDSMETPYIIEVVKHKNKNLFVQLLLHPLYSESIIKDYNQIQCKDGCTLLGHCALEGFIFGLRIVLNDFEPLILKNQISQKYIPRLKRNTDINYLLEDGSTVFHIAVLGNNPKVLQILVENGGDINISQDQGSPLQVALRDFKFKSTFYLASQKNCDFTTFDDNFGNDVLHDCIFLDLEKVFLVIMKNLEEQYEDDPEKVKKIMNQQNFVGNNLILEAAKSQNPFFLDYLLERVDKYEMDINLKNRLGEDYLTMKKVYKTKESRLGQDDVKDYEQMENEHYSSDDESNKQYIKNKIDKQKQKYKLNENNQNDSFQDCYDEPQNQKNVKDQKQLEKNIFVDQTLKELEKTNQERKQLQKQEDKNSLIYIVFFIGLIILFYSLFKGSQIVQEQINLQNTNLTTTDNININESNTNINNVKIQDL